MVCLLIVSCVVAVLIGVCSIDYVRRLCFETFLCDLSILFYELILR